MSFYRALVLVALASLLAPAQNYRIATIAGGGLPQGIGISTVIGGLISSVAVDKAGNVYASLWDHNVVLRLDTKGVLSPFAGNGRPGFSGDGGPAQQAQLLDPQGLAVDQDGNLYIADSANNRIRKVSNGIITTVAGSGLVGNSGDSGLAANAQLSAPVGVAVDSAGIPLRAMGPMDSAEMAVRRPAPNCICPRASRWTWPETSTSPTSPGYVRLRMTSSVPLRALAVADSAMTARRSSPTSAPVGSPSTRPARSMSSMAATNAFAL